MALRLTPQADLDVYYDADLLRYPPSLRERVTRELFKARYGACPSIGFECDGQAIGGIIFDGKTAHIAVLASHHGRWARLLKPALAWLFSLSPEIVIDLESNNPLGLKFVERCGWQRLPRASLGRVRYLMSLDTTCVSLGGRLQRTRPDRDQS